MINELLLLSGNDIPFIEAKVTIHQPTLKEIGYIGERAFFLGSGLLDFSKGLLKTVDKTRLNAYDDFDIFMSIVIDKNSDVKEIVENAFLVLTLIFPEYEVSVRKTEKPVIILKKDNKEFEINKNNFSAFKNIVHSMFSLKTESEKEDFNPHGNMAKKIAEKLKKRHEILLQQAKNKENVDENTSVLSRYASILAIGLQKDLNSLMQYTIYQLYNEFQRFQLKVQWDAYIQAKMAGAKDLEEVDNWMIDLSDIGKNKNKK